MLVLSRKEAERIRLGDSIVVTIIRIGGDKVRLGIEAPADVLVLRDELDPHELAAIEVASQEDLPSPSPAPDAGPKGDSSTTPSEGAVPPSESDAA